MLLPQPQGGQGVFTKRAEQSYSLRNRRVSGAQQVFLSRQREQQMQKHGDEQ